MAITKAQEEARKKFLGSSDVPRIMMGRGFRVALEKLGAVEPVEPDEDDLEALQLQADEDDDQKFDDDPAEEDSFEIQIGHKVESVIMDAYEKEFRPLAFHRSIDTIQSTEYPWLGVHLDGKAVTLSDAINVEAKTVGWYRKKEWGEAGTDDIPPRVMWQVQDQMLVTGLNLTHVPVCFIDAHSLKYLFLGKLPPIKVYIVRADEELQSYIVKKTKVVADCIAQGILPPPDHLDDLLYVYRRDNGQIIEATEEIASACVELALVKAEQKKLKVNRDRLEFLIKGFMKEHAELYYDGVRLATWKKAADGQKLDKGLLERKHPDEFAECLVPTVGSRRFLLKTKKEK